MTKRTKTTLIVFVGILLIGIPATYIGVTFLRQRNTLVVPDEYPSIQEAIDAAEPGNVVFIKAGVYEEELTFKNGIHLKGQSREEVIIRGDARKATVVRVVDCPSGTISELTLEHTAVDKLGKGDTRYQGISLTNSTVTVRGCVVRNSADNGIYIKGPGSSEIIDCDLLNNTWHGLVVFGKGATPIIRNNRSLNNKKSGIYCFTQGIAPILKDNQCSGNKQNGIYFGSGAAGIAQGNKCQGNASHGISVTGEGTAPELKDNLCSENKWCGIRFGEGATGIAQGNKCRGNGQYGIGVTGEGTAPELRDNLCSENEWSGIRFGEGATGIAQGNKCRGNGQYGIGVTGEGTAPELRDNLCSENEWSGIRFGEGATGIAQGNTCQKNEVHGISIADSSVAAVLKNNRCYENGEQGIYFPSNTKARDRNNIRKNNGAIEIRVIRQWMVAGRFDELEALAARLRNEKTRYKSGLWQLDDFYKYVVEGWADLKPSREKWLLNTLDRWIEQKPESITPRIALAKAYVKSAWRARGSGWAHKVSEESWPIFYRELKKADQVIQAAQMLDSKDPELYSIALTVGMGLDKSDAEMDILLDKGLAIEPSYYPLYSQRAYSLLPRWGGQPGQIERLAEHAVKLTKEELGEVFYARIAYKILSREGPATFLIDFNFDYPRIKQGYIDILDRYTQRTCHLNRYCLFACLYKDKLTAKLLFEKIGDNWHKDVWKDEQFFRNLRTGLS